MQYLKFDKNDDKSGCGLKNPRHRVLIMNLNLHIYSRFNRINIFSRVLDCHQKKKNDLANTILTISVDFS